ncbi:MAG: response regulator transcription factor [Actinobacteria bacterium]|nr:MAG: response regulator transcription factor [Actinomycetota bacterium]
MAVATPNRVRILLADAHSATLAGLRMALGGGPFDIVAEVNSADTAVEAAEREHPDVCVLDADMPGGAIRATTEIVRAQPDVAVVVMAATRDDGTMLDVVRAGAVGYLLKDMDPERLRFALLGVTQGEAALPRVLVARLMLEFRLRDSRRRLVAARGNEAELTRREWDVLSLLADGASTQEIAESLGVSAVTVRRHISGVLRKLGVNSREAAVELLRPAD